MKTVRIGICAAIAFAVLLHGAVEGWSESIFEIGAAALLLVWAFHIFREPDLTLRWSPLNWPLLGLLVFGLMQLLAGWTVYPYLTRVELLRWAAYFIYFFLAAQVFREPGEIKMLVWFLILFGFAVALFGIVQHFTFNGKLYWVRKMTEGGLPFGPFVNRNHFAGFMELIVPLGLGLLVTKGVRKELVPLTVLFTIVEIGALVLSGSRGGIVGFFFGIGVLALVLWMRRTAAVQFGAAAMILLAALALVAWLGIGEVAERFARVGPGEVSLMRRGVMLEGSWHIFLDHPWMGTGAGTLIDVYPRYEGLYDGKLIEHAHDDYVEMLADMGLPGGLLAAAFLFLLFRCAFQQVRKNQSPLSAGVHVGAIAGCGSLLLHSFVDFNLHIPSNAALFLILALLATSAALPPMEMRRMRRYTVPIVDSVIPARP
jgi:O-antigen ligase